VTRWAFSHPRAAWFLIPAGAAFFGLACLAADTGFRIWLSGVLFSVTAGAALSWLERKC
jgi:hypothetical protein